MPDLCHRFLRVLCLIVALAVTACSSGPPTVKIVGGGFIFNYRIAEAYYGIVAEVGGEVPEGATLEAEFEDPAGGKTIVLSQPFIPARSRYKFETPPLVGIKADRPYQVILRLFAPGKDTVLAEAMRSFSSNVGQDILPEQPLSVGPGYHPPRGSGGMEPGN